MPDETALHAELRSGERLLWSGRPDPSVLFTRNDSVMIPFSLMWAGFAVFWNIRVWMDETPWFFRLWGLPFLLVGAYLVVGRFVVRQRLKRRLVYGLTDRRALILKHARADPAPGQHPSVTEIPLASTAVAVETSKDGSHATVHFGDHPRASGLRMIGNTGLDLAGQSAPGFYDVADVDGLRTALRSRT